MILPVHFFKNDLFINIIMLDGIKQPANSPYKNLMTLLIAGLEYINILNEILSMHKDKACVQKMVNWSCMINT